MVIMAKGYLLAVFLFLLLGIRLGKGCIRSAPPCDCNEFEKKIDDKQIIITKQRAEFDQEMEICVGTIVSQNLTQTQLRKELRLLNASLSHNKHLLKEIGDKVKKQESVIGSKDAHLNSRHEDIKDLMEKLLAISNDHAVCKTLQQLDMKEQEDYKQLKTELAREKVNRVKAEKCSIGLGVFALLTIICLLSIVVLTRFKRRGNPAVRDNLNKQGQPLVHQTNEQAYPPYNPDVVRNEGGIYPQL